MKQSIVWIGVVLASVWAVAGGDIGQSMSASNATPSHDCKQDRVYKDRTQHLLWQDQAYTDAEVGAEKRNRSTGKAGSQKYAARYCHRLQYAGYADWRLPTSDELTAVHTQEGQAFTYSKGNDYWSSTPATEGKYYVVYPADAIRYARSTTESNYIRCVRCTDKTERRKASKPLFRTR